MLSLLRKSLSGESNDNNDKSDSPQPKEQQEKNAKRHRSGGNDTKMQGNGKLKKSKITRQAHHTSSSDLEESDCSDDLNDQNDQNADTTKSASGESDTKSEVVPKLPAGMPDWGIQLLAILQKELHNVSQSIIKVEEDSKKMTKSIKQIEKKLNKVEVRNKSLAIENVQLKEKL